jgi:hypothetical protein
MENSLLFFGNCQSRQLASVAQAMLPISTRVSHASFNLKEHEKTSYLSELHNFTHILVNFSPALELISRDPVLIKKTTVIPDFAFHGYHPDVVYMKDKISNESLFTGGSHASSQIANYVFSQNISIETGAKFFSREVYERLGYFDAYEHSLEALNERFDKLGFDFTVCRNLLNDSNCHMREPWHPKISLVSSIMDELFQRLRLPCYLTAAEALGLNENGDPLANEGIWLPYHEIGEFLGLCSPKGFCVRKPRSIIKGATNYLHWYFSELRSRGVRPSSLVEDERSCPPFLKLTSVATLLQGYQP